MEAMHRARSGEMAQSFFAVSEQATLLQPPSLPIEFSLSSLFGETSFMYFFSYYPFIL